MFLQPIHGTLRMSTLLILIAMGLLAGLSGSPLEQAQSQGEENLTTSDEDENLSVTRYGMLIFLTSVLLAFFRQDSFDN